MTAHDPLFDELRGMFDCYAGPAAPVLRARRSRTLRRLVLVVAVAALLAVASIASADGLGLFDGGQPVSPELQAQIAKDSVGAPPGLDPGIEADTAVRLITIPTEKGSASLIVSRATRASYCMGIALSWLGGRPGLGCNGPGGRQLAISWGLLSPGPVGTSPGFVDGHVQTEGAAQVRVVLEDGRHVDLDLTDGFFLGELDPGTAVLRFEALDGAGAVIATAEVQPVHGIPTSTSP
jgi:hypothetical protein